MSKLIGSRLVEVYVRGTFAVFICLMHGALGALILAFFVGGFGSSERDVCLKRGLFGLTMLCST